MKVLVLTTSFPRWLGDEASLFLGRLIDSLSDLEVSGTIIVPYDKDEEPSDSRGSFSIARYRYGLLSRGALAFGQGILPNLRKNPLLVLQVPFFLIQMFLFGIRHVSECQLIHGHWIVTAIPAYFIKLFSGKPYMLTVRGEDIKLLRGRLRFLFRPFVQRATRITTVSNQFAAELKECLPLVADKISVITNGISRFQTSSEAQNSLRTRLHVEREQGQPGHKILCYVGRIIALKQPEFLMRCLSLLEYDSEVVLVLAGRVTEEYKTELMLLASEFNIKDRVRIPGTLSPEEIGVLYSISTLYVSASSHEGRSNAVLEALAAGLPVCISDIPGHREVIGDSEIGLLFDLADPEEAAKKISVLLSDANRLKSLADNATRAVSHLTWEESARQYREHFLQLLSELPP